MDYFRPHTLPPRPRFEGYYNKFTIPSGAHIVLIICSVPDATTRPHMVQFIYVPASFPQIPHFQREIWVDDIRMIDRPRSADQKGATEEEFRLDVPGVQGGMVMYSDGSTTYTIIDPDGQFTFTATTSTEDRTPWIPNSPNSTPEGLLINLSLPLHWHVHTLSTPCTYTLTIATSSPYHTHMSPSSPDFIPNTPASVHQEKNWASSFPSSHVWVKASNTHPSPQTQTQTQTHICLAGGSILHTQAYLLTYHARNPSHSVSFTPPLAMSLSLFPSLSPTLDTHIDWTSRTVRIAVSGFTTKIEIEACAERGGFVGMSAPFGDGHRLNSLGQSFGARVNVKVSRRGWLGWGSWMLVCEEVFERGGLEFGAAVYGQYGSERCVS